MQSLWGRDRRQTNALQVSHNIKVFRLIEEYWLFQYWNTLKEENCVVNHSLQPGWPTVKQGAATARQVWDSTLEGSPLFTRYLLASCDIIVFFCFVFASQGFHVFNSEKCQNQCWQPIKTNNKDDQSWQWFNSLSNLKKNQWLSNMDPRDCKRM